MQTRRAVIRTALSALSLGSVAEAAPARQWKLGINTYCLRFWRWNDRQLIDYCIKEKLDAIFLQDSLDPGVMDPAHWAEVRAWTKDAGLHIETGGSALLPKTPEGIPPVGRHAAEEYRPRQSHGGHHGAGAARQ